MYAKRDPYGRPNSCSLRRQGSISPKFGARDQRAGAVKVLGCGKSEEDDSSVKRPEVCNTPRGEVLLRTRGEGELAERKSGDFRRRSVEVNSTSPTLR